MKSYIHTQLEGTITHIYIVNVGLSQRNFSKGMDK